MMVYIVTATHPEFVWVKGMFAYMLFTTNQNSTHSPLPQMKAAAALNTHSATSVQGLKKKC